MREKYMKRRERRGAIDFDFPESKIILNRDMTVTPCKIATGKQQNDTSID